MSRILTKKLFVHWLCWICVFVLLVTLAKHTYTPKINAQNTDDWQRYADSKFAIAFDHPASWNVHELVFQVDSYRALEISKPTLGRIIITKEANPEQLNPYQWFQSNRSKYHPDLITDIAAIEICGKPSLILSQPDSCQTVPMILAFVGNGDAMFIISYYEEGSRPVALELGRLLETLSFDGQQGVTDPIPESYFEFPMSATDVPCADTAESVATTTVRKCSGADMYIPTEGAMNVPWACFDDDTYCLPYKTRPEDDPDCDPYNIGFPINCNPHSGIDIFGGQAAGVTPIYATFSGYVDSIGSSAVRILFDSPYAGQSAYMTHMATGSEATYEDFRQVLDGQRVIAGETLIGFQGDYASESVGVHLHISYNNRSTDFWPTLNPTDFLRAEYLKYYPGWNHTGNPVTCQESGVSTAIDVVLIIDSSGSMSWNDSLNKRLDAAKAYLTASSAGDFVGVVDFDYYVRLASPLLELPDNKPALVAAIDTIDSSGGTNVGLGIQEGCSALIDSTSANSTKAAILLTDGQGAFNNEDQCFIDHGWSIFTFGFGDSDDYLLQQIADNTGGEFARLPTSDLVCEFQRVREKIAGTEPAPCIVNHVDPNQYTVFYASVPVGQAQATFSSSWLGSDVEMTLTSPSGRVIDRDTVAPDVVHDLGSTFEIYTILNPEPGDWEVSLYGADVPPEGEDVVFGFTTLPASSDLPSVDAGLDQTVDEGDTVSLEPATFTDPDPDDTHTATIDWDDGTVEPGIVDQDASTVSGFHIYADDGIYTVAITVCDDDGGCGEDSFDVTVNNIAPAVGPITAPIDPNEVNTLIEVTADFTDPGVLDTHTAVWEWGDGDTSAGTVTEENGSGTVSGAHTYDEAGVYTIKLTVTDKDGDSGESTFSYIVIYDPDGGFVTGGGWIESPEGAYTPEPELGGFATFGFVSKYLQGQNEPSGETEFHFNTASNFEFHSTDYEWLVVNKDRAMYKGTGTANGMPGYSFKLWAIDGDLFGAGGMDRFRIKIWAGEDETQYVYDNQLGDPDHVASTTALESGSIIIHSTNWKKH